MFETTILIFFIMSIIIYKLFYKSNIVNIEAFNKISYLVRDRDDAQNAANMLATIMISLDNLINTIISNYNKKYNHLSKCEFFNNQNYICNCTNNNSDYDNKYIKYVRVIKDRLPYVKISENPANSKFTSYSINKGEELVFCIRNKTSGEIHDLNELLYVAIHEIAHIGCPEIGHTHLFRMINLYLLKKAVCYGIYKYTDYSKDTKNYCGMELTSTILPDIIICNK
jgi:hypothetical protein